MGPQNLEKLKCLLGASEIPYKCGDNAASLLLFILFKQLGSIISGPITVVSGAGK